jgi:hypothetical protein
MGPRILEDDLCRVRSRIGIDPVAIDRKAEEAGDAGFLGRAMPHSLDGPFATRRSAQMARDGRLELPSPEL